MGDLEPPLTNGLLRSISSAVDRVELAVKMQMDHRVLREIRNLLYLNCVLLAVVIYYLSQR